jgi:glycine/D-amino acid oxidase-like deaminating enzyme
MVMGAADVVVVGAGVVGAACAYQAARAGLRVAVVERGTVAGGTTGAGEGNLLVSDKRPGPELDLALRSLSLWREFASSVDPDAIELEAKGGLVVAATPAELDGLRALGLGQRAAGVDIDDVSTGELAGHEPRLAAGLAGGARYAQDMQVQPMLAAAHLLRAAVRRYGAAFHPGAEVTAIERSAGRVVGVRTSAGRIATGAVVNAAGTWAGGVASLAGVELPVRPRRGFVLVTQPLPVGSIRHKVYTAGYLGNVVSDSSGLQTSAVVEATRAGCVLIGASRERVGFDSSFLLPVLRRLSVQAIELFPFLAEVRVIRTYRGFRPYSPDHLPMIGPDARVPGLLHACGHEGAGICLAPATAEIITAALTGTDAVVDPEPFAPERFDRPTAEVTAVEGERRE